MEATKAERVLAARAIIVAYYQLPGNEVGGPLHVVTDDGNVDDHSIEFSIDIAEREGNETAVAVGKMLLAMAPDERTLAVAWYNNPDLLSLAEATSPS
jgi:hypothetical protein